MRHLALDVDSSYPFACELAFSPSGRELVGAAPCCLLLWDLSADTPVPVWTDESGGMLFRFALSPCGRYAAGAEDRCLVIWDLAARKPSKWLAAGRYEHIADLAFTPAGHELLTVLLEGGGVVRRRVGTWRKKPGFGRSRGQLAGRRALFDGHLAFSPDGRTLATSHAQKGSGGLHEAYGIKLWHFPGGGHRRTAMCGPDPICQMLFSPDGRTLAAQHDYRRVCLYEAQTLRLLAEYVPPAPADPEKQMAVVRMAFQPGGRLLAVSGGTTVALLDANSLRPVQVYDWGIGRTFAVAFSPDGMRAAVSALGLRVVIWDVD
jgi:WD40 repeat protein